MTEYKTNNVCVRIHGSTERNKLEKATLEFLKAAEKTKKLKKGA